MKTPYFDSADFLTAVSFAAPEDSPWKDRDPSEFHPDVAAWAECFCRGFRWYLDNLGISIPDVPQSFGGNCYFSLSGHGCGFWDDRETEFLQSHLETYAGGRKHRFEGLDFYKERKTGKWQLSFKPAFVPHYLEKTFHAEGGPVPCLTPPQVREFPHAHSDIPSIKAIYGTRIVSLNWIVKRPKEIAKWDFAPHPEILGSPDKPEGGDSPQLLTVTMKDKRQFVAGFQSLGSLTRFAKIRNFDKLPGPSIGAA